MVFPVESIWYDLGWHIRLSVAVLLTMRSTGVFGGAMVGRDVTDRVQGADVEIKMPIDF